MYLFLTIGRISSLEPQLSKSDAKRLVAAADPSRLGFVDIVSLHNQLVSIEVIHSAFRA